MNTTFKKALLAGTAIVAVGAFAIQARAADQEIDGTVAVPTDESALTAADDLTNLVDDGAAGTDAGFVDTNSATISATDININEDAAVGVIDSTGGADGVLAFSGDANIQSGNVLTLILGGTEADGTGTNTTDSFTVTLADDIAASAGVGRGGTFTVVGVANFATGTTSFASAGDTLMTAVNVTGGAGGAGAAGHAVTATFGDTSADTFNSTGLAVTGGAGGANAGGASTTTINGATTVGATGLSVTGGAAGAAAAGGAATLTVNHALSLSGALTVTGGNDAAGNTGGAASATFKGAVTSSSSLTVAGGAATSGGTAGAATVELQGDTTFSAITLDTTDAAATLVAQVLTDNTGDFSITGAISGASNGEGVLTVIDDDATTADTVTFNSNIGQSHNLATINVADGTGHEGGSAVFDGTVAATTINVGAADTGNEAATADFNDDVTATTINVVAETTAAVNSTATFAGNVTGAVTFADAGGASVATVRYDGTSAQTQTGAITTGNDNAGQVIVGNTGTGSDVSFTAAIGVDAGGDIAGFTVVSGSTANIVNDIFTDSGNAASLGLNIAGTLNVDSGATAVSLDDDTGDISVSGHIGITGDNNVDLTAASDIFIDGASTFETALTAAATTTLSAGANLDLGTVDDTTIIAGNQIIATATTKTFISDASDKTVTLAIRAVVDDNVSVFNPDTTTVVNATGGAGNIIVDSSGTAVALKVKIDADSSEFDDGATITVVDATDLEDSALGDVTWTNLIASGDVELVDTGLVDIQDNTSTDDLLVKTVFREAKDVFEDGSSGAGAAQELMDLTAAQTTDELEEARGNLLAAADADAAQAVGESLASTNDGSNVAASMAFGSRTAAFNDQRLAALRTGSETGMAAGSTGSGVGWWGQLFGTTGNQDDRHGIDGYDFDSVGVAVGVDTQNVADDATLGVALSYANTNVDSDNSNSTNTDIDSFQVALYGDFDVDDRTYVSGQVGYIWGNNDTTRHNVGGIAGLTANGDFDSNQFNVRAEVGRDFMAGGSASGMKLTPKLLADYTYYNADDYTETGAGGANLTVDQDSLNVFNVGVGADASWIVKHSNGAYCEPALHAAVRYDLADDDVQATNTFAGGGNAFQTDGLNPARTTLDLGAGVTYHATTNWDLKAEYNFEGKQDFTSHSALLKAGYKF